MVLGHSAFKTAFSQWTNMAKTEASNTLEHTVNGKVCELPEFVLEMNCPVQNPRVGWGGRVSM